MVLRNFGISCFWIALLAFIMAQRPVEAQDQRPYQSLQHALFSSGQLTGEKGPQNVQWIDEGERYSYVEQNLQHFAPEIRIYNPSTDSDSLLFHPAEYTFPNSDIPFHFESFEWAADHRHILFQTNFSPQYRYSGTSDYYYYDLDEKELKLIVHSAFNAEISPDGKKVAYHRDGEMFVYDLDAEEESQLTQNSGENLFNGRFGWVYEEEFGKAQAWKWSPDSRHIAYWQTDERDVDRFVTTDYEGIYPDYTDIPYPKAGSRNPTVKIGAVNLETGEHQWLETDREGGLIPRIYWTANKSELAVIWMNRQQTELKLYFFDVDSGEGNIVYEEKSDNAWIDIYDSPSDMKDMFFFPKDRNEFFRISDKDGYNHIYRFDYSGNLINQVTRGEWDVTGLFAMNHDTETLYFESTEISPLERHLYSIQYDGSQKIRFTRQSGRHQFNVSPNGKYYIDRWSNTTTPPKVELFTTKNGGEKLKTYTENERTQNHINQFAYQPRELFRFTTSYGVELDGYLIRPHDFNPDKKYPLIMMVYGGPGYQGVYNEFETSTWAQFLSQQGYVVVNVNNRGSGGYGRAFKKSVYKKLGQLEAEDFAETAKYLGQRDWIDENRVAIRGHSYGGFMAAYAALKNPGLFKVSLVGAPVTDWRLYDTIYTERYMGLPEENEENYIQSSVIHHANLLRGKMLVAHSSMDENVHLQHTMQMITAFTNAGKDVDLRIFPSGRHGVVYNEQSYLLLHKVYTDYLNTHLKPKQ